MNSGLNRQVDSEYWDDAEQRLRSDGESLPERQRAMLQADIAEARKRRDEMYRNRQRYPVIAEQAIGAPLVVIGLPRSGTTLLHGLLAQDPAARSPLMWETEDYSLPPGLDPEADAPRIAASQAAVARLPEAMLARHRKGPMMPEECGSAFLPQAFVSMVPWASYGVDRHFDWVRNEADMAPGFRLHRHGLQHLQAFSPRQWWVLKSPTHLFCLDALLAEYPDARLVWIHRDPADVLPSNASLIHFVRGLRGLDADKAALGARVVELWRDGLSRAMEYRRSSGRERQFIDVRHGDLSRQPIATARAIYQHFGMTLSAEAETAMAAFMERNGKGKHGGHDYSAEAFGLTRSSLQADFADYIDTFGLEVKP